MRQIMKSTSQKNRIEEKNCRTIRVKVLYFAQVCELVNGKHFEEREVAEKTRAAELVFSILKSCCPESLMKSITISINCKIASKDDFLSDGDEVALIPPVTGG